MSYLAKSQQCKYLSCDEDENDCGFQYVPVKEFKHIVEDAKRKRNNKKDDVVWSTFLREKEHLKLNGQSKYKTTRPLAESFEEVDRELMKFDADSLLRSRYDIGGFVAKDNEEKQSTKFLQHNSPPTKENGTGSNILLPIPEEENDYFAVRSSGSQKPNISCMRKSRSAQHLRKKNIQCKCYHYNGDIHYYSSPDISPDRFSNDDLIPIHPDPVAVTKILAIQKKITIVLDSILFELDRIPLPDGENDLLRRQQRVLEFSTRLSRNYLYDLGRQISDIERHIKAIDPENGVKLGRRAVIAHMQAIEQKLISAHQLLFAALSAYWKHIPSSVMKNHPGKIKNMLQVVMQLKNMCSSIHLTSKIYCAGDDIDTFLEHETENRCIMILSKFRPNSGNDSVPNHSAKSAALTPSKVNKKRNRKTNTNRFNMYATDMKSAKTYLSKNTYSMFQLPRRSNFQITGKQPGVILTKRASVPPAVKLSYETPGSKIKKINVPQKEDEIQTMMETVQQDLDVESLESTKFDKKSEILNQQSYKYHENYKRTKESQRLMKSSISDKNKNERDDEREKDISCLLPVIENLLSFVDSNPNNPKTIPKNSIETIYEYLQLCQLTTKPSKLNTYEAKEEIMTGEKNMKLISCYTDKDGQSSENSVDFKNNNDRAKFNDGSCQAHYFNRNPTFELLVSESAVSCINHYRKEYQRYLESNPMYKSTTQNKPWEIVSWISDKLVNELIVDLANDLQIKDVIQKLFDLEFKEF